MVDVFKNACKFTRLYGLMNFSLAMQIFFLLYGFTGNPLYDREMFVPYFIACAISVNYANNDDGSELE